MVRRYRGRAAGWIVANEVTSPIGDDADELGFRTNVPWYETIGREYVARMFRLARRNDPHATLVLNEFGFETTNEFGDDPVGPPGGRSSASSTRCSGRTCRWTPWASRPTCSPRTGTASIPGSTGRFLKQISDRGLKILITEMDVLDDGLPAEIGPRDRGVAEIYADYLDATLANPAVKALITFGLSDRYTWLQEDYPREDGAARRPLPYDEDLQAKPALRALRRELRSAPRRRPLWPSRRR